MRIVLKRFAMIAAVLIVVGIVVNQILPPSEEARAAVVELATEQRYSFGGVGFVNSIPEREDRFFMILGSRHSDKLFRELFERGTVEAKAYALAGLRLRDREGFKECAERFVRDGMRVETQQGCIVSYSTSEEVVAAIERSEVEQYLKLRRERRFREVVRVLREKVGMRSS